MADASHIGLEIDRFSFPVEAGKLREWAVAVGGQDVETVPLTFAAVASHHRDQAAMVAALDLDIRRVVVGSVDWEYRAPVRVGDTLTGARVVTGVRTNDRGMTFITIETALRRADGEVAIVQTDTVIELP
ncbi:hypothetical protein GKE82_16660 [Conexibacter sp. W3-3-2]|uniref:Acyl dehydratase n=1 Tax=Paraconexibacter algicola TaxID=2133960 RepID=A0A2T4UK14_9ACTN|nr:MULTISPECIES: MaoC family dehydratase N-terminal domain-containing protein [Solirubrobacterales]MTD45875.1 hypothetical protein [Conexibacter sp. W3-3-2]PTL59528.1 acyl dehydratase [Paraconexibacter algicola]